MVSLCLPLASKNFGLSGNLISKHDNSMLGDAQIIMNKFHDLNKKNPLSILNVSGIINHAKPENN